MLQTPWKGIKSTGKGIANFTHLRKSNPKPDSPSSQDEMENGQTRLQRNERHNPNPLSLNGEMTHGRSFFSNGSISDLEDSNQDSDHAEASREADEKRKSEVLLSRKQKRALSRICDHIQDAQRNIGYSSGKELPRNTQPRDVESEVAAILGVFNAKVRDLEGTVKVLKEQYENTTAEMKKEQEDEQRNHVKKMMILRDEHSATEVRSREEIAILNKEKSSMNDRHTGEQRRLREGIEKQMKSQIYRLNSDHAEETQKLLGQLRAWEEDKQHAQAQYEAEKEKLRQGCENYRKESLREQRFKYQTEINQLKGDLDLLTAEKRTTQITHEKKVYDTEQKTKAIYAEQINQQQTEIGRLNNELARVKRQNADERTKLEGNHQRYVAGLQAQHNQDRSLLVQKHDQEKRQLIKKHKDDREQLEQASTTLLRNHAAEKAKLKEEFEARRKQDKRGHVKALAGLKVEKEVLMGALVARDHFKPITDHDLASRFQDVAKDIDSFARFKWDTNKQAQWLWSQDILKNSTDNERRLKQHILQSQLWEILFRYIFCTPFRVLGGEGKLLELGWTDALGQGDMSRLEWPKPSSKAEKWRYEQVRNCFDAIEADGSALKTMFDKSVSLVATELFETLGRVCSVDDDVHAEMEDLARKAAKLWLAMGAQRCRILIVFPTRVHKSLLVGKARRERGEAIELIVNPEVRRIGNSQGEELGREEIVSGCVAEVSSFIPD